MSVRKPLASVTSKIDEGNAVVLGVRGVVFEKFNETDAHESALGARRLA